MHTLRTKTNNYELSIDEIKEIQGNENLSDEQAESIRLDLIKLCDFMALNILQTK